MGKKLVAINKLSDEELQRKIDLHSGRASSLEATSGASITIAACMAELDNREVPVVVPNLCHGSNKGGRMGEE